MHSVAAEVAQKVVVLLQDNNLDSGTGQQQRVNQARRTTTGNTDLGSQDAGHAPTVPGGSRLTGRLPTNRSTGCGHLALSAQRLDLALEIVCRRKGSVHRGESQIRHLIEFSQRTEDRKPDLVTGDFR